MQQTLKKLDSWVKVIQKSILVLAGVEVLIVLVIGVASNNVTENSNSNIWIGILSALGLLYIIITVIKIAYNKSFPISMVDELKAKKELELSQQQIARKDAINNYISNTIKALSNCKCEIPKQEKGNDWRTDSDEDFVIGIKTVLNTFNNVLNILLNTTNFKFTTGLYTNNFRAISENNLPKKNEGMFLIRDDYELHKSGIIRDLMTSEKLTGIELDIQNLVKVSLHNGIFKVKSIKVKEGRKVLLICANIKDLKNDREKGVLFVLTEPIRNLPEDTESIFKLFTSILSHWLDLYEHEVISRQIQIMSEEIGQMDLNDEDDKIELKDGEDPTEYEEVK